MAEDWEDAPASEARVGRVGVSDTGRRAVHGQTLAGRYRGFVSVVDGGGAAAERDAVAVRGRGDGGRRRRPQVASREGRHRPGEVQGPRRDVSVPLVGGGWTRFLLSLLAFRRMHNLSFTRRGGHRVMSARAGFT